MCTLLTPCPPPPHNPCPPTPPALRLHTCLTIALNPICLACKLCLFSNALFTHQLCCRDTCFKLLLSLGALPACLPTGLV
jgi:hypothetical protein